MQAAALDTGMCTESDASLDLQVLPQLSAARAVCAATCRASMWGSFGVWPRDAPLRVRRITW
eukprot:3217367-Pyramimonas_sp.AAC.1